jgi:S1 RNA binding domain protein
MAPINRTVQKFNIGDAVDAEVFKITSFGAFVRMNNGQRGFIHISQIAENYVKNISDHLKLGDKVKARIVNIEGDKIDLTLKKPKEDIASYPKGKEFKASVFEDKLKTFLAEK